VSYYHAKRKMTAALYLEERNRVMRDKALRDIQLEKSRVWLDEYHKRPQRSGFNWAPRWPFIVQPTPTGASNGQEILGEYTVVADAIAEGEGGGICGRQEAGDQAAGASLGDAQGQSSDFTEQDRTPF
jgi:hypothetical protein